MKSAIKGGIAGFGCVGALVWAYMSTDFVRVPEDMQMFDNNMSQSAYRNNSSGCWLKEGDLLRQIASKPNNRTLVAYTTTQDTDTYCSSGFFILDDSRLEQMARHP